MKLFLKIILVGLLVMMLEELRAQPAASQTNTNCEATQV